MKKKNGEIGEQFELVTRLAVTPKMTEELRKIRDLIGR
jgi:hypothetical protein